MEIERISVKKTCCFTGHRPQKLPWKFNENDERCIRIKQRAEEEIEKAIIEGYTIFISGMALGFDMMCAEIVLKLSERYSNIKLLCFIPCSDQCKKWEFSQKERYNKILNKAHVYQISNSKYRNGCMQERNRKMVEFSSKIIALFDGTSGGTEYTIKYAKGNGLDIVFIKP